ncbi:MAG: sulfur carrier protein ThiS [bacterium]
MNIKIRINGDERTIAKGLTVAELLDVLKVRRQTAIVEHNRNILDRNSYEKTIVIEGDEFELVRFVGGG